jgi:vitamin B12 transporter
MARLCTVGAVALSAFVAKDARAQDADAGIVLPPVTVPLPPAEPASESPARRDPTGALSHVDASAHAGEAKDAAELLSSAPGVLVQEVGGVGQMKTISLRGASPNGVLVFLDGVPLNGAGGEVDLSSIPPAVVDQIDVLRGGAGAKYGSGGLGGAVNVTTKPAREDLGLAGELSYGSFDTETAQVSGTGPLLGGAALALAHVSHSAGDFPYSFNPTPQLPNAVPVTQVRDNNDASMAGGLLKWRRPLGEAWTVDAMLEASTLSRGLAGMVDDPTPDAREMDTRLAAALHVEHLLDRGSLSARAWLRDDGIALSGSSELAGNAPSFFQRELVVGAEAEASYLLGFNGLTATLQAGNEGLAVTDGPSPQRGLFSAMASDELLLLAGRLSLVPSFRFDQAGAFSGVSPKLGAALQLPAGFVLRANGGQAFRAPSFLELYVAQGTLVPNPSLQPERALYGDGQLSHETQFSRVSAGGFYALYENLISYELYPPLLAKPYNFETASVEGLEAEAELRPRPWMTATAAYTLTFSQNLRDDPRYYLKELPYRPRHRLFARASGGIRWIRPRIEVLYQSEQFINRANGANLPARAFVNAGASSDLWLAPLVTLALEAKNLFDTQAEDFDGYPLPGRAFFATLSVAWDPPHPTTRKTP